MRSVDFGDGRQLTCTLVSKRVIVADFPKKKESTMTIGVENSENKKRRIIMKTENRRLLYDTAKPEILTGCL